MDKVGFESDLEAEFERAAALEDESASRDILASGMPIHIASDETPDGCVVRVYPDGREEVVRFDRQAAAKFLGA